MKFLESNQFLRKILIIKLFKILKREYSVFFELSFQDLSQLFCCIVPRLQKLSCILGSLLIINILILHDLDPSLKEAILLGSLDSLFLDQGLFDTIFLAFLELLFEAILNWIDIRCVVETGWLASVSTSNYCRQVTVLVWVLNHSCCRVRGRSTLFSLLASRTTNYILLLAYYLTRSFLLCFFFLQLLLLPISPLLLPDPLCSLSLIHLPISFLKVVWIKSLRR